VAGPFSICRSAVESEEGTVSETNQAFSLNRISQIAVNVRDLARATAFYRDTLGMRFLFDAPGMAFFDCGGVRLMLGVAEREELNHPASILYYHVDDIGTAHETLSHRGVAFDAEPHCIHKDEKHELWMAFFRDSERNLLALSSTVAV
jgi:methylmalonyl-CoA/ethylmalonyl-CoA epimerase